jgi:hypothetical protein
VLERRTGQSATGFRPAAVWPLLLLPFLAFAIAGPRAAARPFHAPGFSSGWLASAAARRSAPRTATRETRRGSALTKSDAGRSFVAAPPSAGGSVFAVTNAEAAFGPPLRHFRVPSVGTAVARSLLRGAAHPRAPPA